MTQDPYRDAHQEPISAARLKGEKLVQETMTDPLRHPEFASEKDRVKRAWIFVALTTLFPGSVQLIAGHKKLGRRLVAVTATVWVFLLGLLVLWLLKRQWVFALLTNSFFLLILAIVLGIGAIAWILVFLDTLRIIGLKHLPQKSKTPVALVLALLMGLGGAGLGYSAYVTLVGRDAITKIFGGHTNLEAVDGRYNILLMGGDAGADRVGRRPDSMTVVSIDADTGQAITISIPRNTQNAIFSEDSPLWQVYPEGFNCGNECILNALYSDVTANHADLYPNVSDPGAQATMEAISGITGLTIKNYMLIDMDGFAQLIDALGGITMDVGGRVPIGGGTNEITGEKNPIDGYIEPGVQHLDGFHALWFARSREGATDYEREARQRCVQAAMLKQLDPANVLTKFSDITAAGEQNIETNLPSNSLSGLGDVALKSKNYSLIQYAAGPPYYDDMFPTYPDFDQLHADIQKVIEDSKQGVEPTTSAAGLPAVSGEVAPVTYIQTVSSLSENGICSVP